jgi:hypothetical protein
MYGDKENHDTRIVTIVITHPVGDYSITHLFPAKRVPPRTFQDGDECIRLTLVIQL